MKLRIFGNSIRLRLSQSEVRRLETEGLVSEKTEFGFDSNDLDYSVRANQELDSPQATFQDHRIRVELPTNWLSGWERDDRVGFNAELPLGNGRVLKLIVEKDFKCLTVRPGEDESDNFPNPLEKHGEPGA